MAAGLDEMHDKSAWEKAEGLVKDWTQSAVRGLCALTRLELPGVLGDLDLELRWAHRQLVNEGIQVNEGDARHDLAGFLQCCSELEAVSGRVASLAMPGLDSSRRLALLTEPLRLQLTWLAGVTEHPNLDALVENAGPGFPNFLRRLHHRMHGIEGRLFPTSADADWPVDDVFAEAQLRMHARKGIWRAVCTMLHEFQAAASTTEKFLQLRVPAHTLAAWNYQRRAHEAKQREKCCCPWLCGSAWQPPQEMLRWRLNIPTASANVKRQLRLLAPLVAELEILIVSDHDQTNAQE